MQVGTTQFNLEIDISSGVTLSPASLNFSPQPLNTTSHRQKVTLTNGSDAIVTISAINFDITDQRCPKKVGALRRNCLAA
jgi:hypothetical protein